MEAVHSGMASIGGFVLDMADFLVAKPYRTPIK
jgi:hypothetical protein